jgi:hypothetical protein
MKLTPLLTVLAAITMSSCDFSRPAEKRTNGMDSVKADSSKTHLPDPVGLVDPSKDSVAGK